MTAIRIVTWAAIAAAMSFVVWVYASGTGNPQDLGKDIGTGLAMGIGMAAYKGIKWLRQRRQEKAPGDKAP